MNIHSSSNINQYLSKHSARLSRSAFPLESIDLSKIEGIQRDIPLFHNTNLNDIKFITKWFQVLNLARGCREQCTFCLRNALTPAKETDKRINSILWDDLIRFTQGFSKLSERLGTNVFSGNSHITLFEDANLPDAKIKDKEGNIHNVREAVQNIYESLKLPFVFVTSGWHPKNQFTQNSAEELCEYVRQNPECTKEFAVSINPFFAGSKDFYIEKAANALKTFLPLFKDGEASILFKYNYPNGIDSAQNGIEAATELYLDIFKKLKSICESSLEGYEKLKPENVTRHNENNYIENKGRGQKFFLPDDVDKNNRKLFTESFEWFTLTPEQKTDFAYNYTTKNVDINGNVYLITPSEQAIETDLGLNFINKDKTTAKVHSDVKFYPYQKNN